MSGNLNNQNYFFSFYSSEWLGNAAAPTGFLTSGLINKDVIGFTFTEELGKMYTGTLSIYDPSNKWSKLFRYGTPFTMSFGYKKWNADVNNLSSNITTNLRPARSGINCLAQNPSGGGSQNGVITFNMTFIAENITENVKNRTFTSGTLYSIVKQIFGEMDIVNSYIDSSFTDIKFTTKTPLNQREYNTGFISYLAKKYHAKYVIANSPNGMKSGLFIADKAASTSVMMKGWLAKNGCTVFSRSYYYNSGSKSNVKSYTWQNHIGDSGQGGVITGPDKNGDYQVRKYQADKQRVVTYVINKSRIAATLKDSENAGELGGTMKKLLSSKTFDEIVKYFDAKVEETAPDGTGYTVNVSVIGDPYAVPGMPVDFKSGFPSEITSEIIAATNNKQFYILKGAHSISKAGYSTELEVIDEYTLNTGSLTGTREAAVTTNA